MTDNNKIGAIVVGVGCVVLAMVLFTILYMNGFFA